MNIHGRLSGLMAAPKMVSVPLMRPDEPRPATALPMMSMVDELAAPQITEPSSKTKKNARYDHYDHCQCHIIA
jgi:hypothetical protein